MAELIAYHYREAISLARLIGQPIDDAARRRAVDWLGRAADAAAAGAAMPEAARHLRAAIDLADPDQLPELHLRLGETQMGGDEGIAAFARAYELGREQGRSADFLLLALALRLNAMTRWFASVARQPSFEELERLFAEARSADGPRDRPADPGGVLHLGGVHPVLAREPRAPAEPRDPRTSRDRRPARPGDRRGARRRGPHERRPRRPRWPDLGERRSSSRGRDRPASSVLRGSTDARGAARRLQRLRLAEHHRRRARRGARRDRARDRGGPAGPGSVLRPGRGQLAAVRDDAPGPLG